MNSELRTKFLDFDARKDPKTDFYCIMCQVDLNPESKTTRWVHMIDGGYTILHPEDESKYVKDNADMGFFPIGKNCVTKLGKEWTHPQ